jgi:hypothetical protein
MMKKVRQIGRIWKKVDEVSMFYVIHNVCNVRIGCSMELEDMIKEGNSSGREYCYVRTDNASSQEKIKEV